MQDKLDSSLHSTRCLSNFIWDTMLFTRLIKPINSQTIYVSLFLFHVNDSSGCMEIRSQYFNNNMEISILSHLLNGQSVLSTNSYLFSCTFHYPKLLHSFLKWMLFSVHWKLCISEVIGSTRSIEKNFWSSLLDSHIFTGTHTQRAFTLIKKE